MGAVGQVQVLRTDERLPLDCRVMIPDFEGPLDLLLQLIRNHELDILNLPISTITRQYLSYLDYMRRMNLDLAAEYLVMAATLTYLKSQVILPQEASAELTGQDPRAQLIKRLVALKNYKDLAKNLSERPRLYRDVFVARNTGTDEIEDGIEPEVAISNPFQLVEALRRSLSRTRTLVHKVVMDEVPIASCVAQIVDRLKVDERVSFQSLLPTLSKPQHMISMFLGCLEMSKMQMTHLEQNETFGPIHISRKAEVGQLDRANELIRGGEWT